MYRGKTEEVYLLHINGKISKEQNFKKLFSVKNAKIIETPSIIQQ